MTDYVWHPLTPSEVRATLEPLAIDWWVAGGVAIDMFVGRKTRDHGDIDVSALRRDVVRLAPLLASWDVCIPHDGTLMPWDGSGLAEEDHQFWVRRPGSEVWSFEILLEYTDGNDWLYRRDPRIRTPLDAIARQTAHDIPFLAPEICLLYKANLTKANESQFARNAADFDVAVPMLDAKARLWLRNALDIAFPGHPWVRRL